MCMEKPLLTRQEVADYLGMNVRTIDRYIKEGLLVAFRPKGTQLVRIHQSELEAFLANHPKEMPGAAILSAT